MSLFNILSIFIHPAPPDPPVNVKASRVGENFVELDWKQPHFDGGSAIIGYVIYMSPFKTGEWTRVGQADSFETTSRITKLNENMSYYFSVQAQNKIGTSKICDAGDAVTTKKGLCKYKDYIL